MSDDNTGFLADHHAEFLSSQAIDLDKARALGVRSLMSREDNPQEGVWGNWANHPAILFPWTSHDGRVEYQVRPDNPTEDSRGRDRKYVFRKDMTPLLWAVRVVPGSTRVVIVEGTKQCLAAASYAPAGVSVYGIAGCRSWQINGRPIPDLEVVDGCEVVVILDADAATNPQVFQAGLELAQALDSEGATKVLFTRLPGGDDKAGLDDVLASRTPGRRAGWLAGVINRAKLKPADKKPVPKGKDKGEPKPTGDRVQIIVNRDRRTVIDDLAGALIKRWNAIELFCHGGVLSRRKKDSMKPVDRGSFHDLVQDTAITVSENEGANGTTYSYTWPDPGTMSATMSQAERFAPLDRISHAPFVRDDGEVITEAGYDAETRTLLLPDPVFEGLTIPEKPTAEQIAAARDYLLTEWLGDFPFDSDVDRANALALIVTPAIRGMVPKVPLAIIDGLQMGVGKNLLADSLLTVYTGSAAEPMNWVSEPEELRKQITAAFRTGAEFFVFDEAHTVEGAPLAQALTASTWQDRILGVSNMANFPNVITWISLGNQVQVRGDLTRRVYRIALRPRYANPQDRAASSFRHPGQSGLDLGSWTRLHRAELMTAILTLVRAWFAEGQPRPARSVSFGSFEVWEKIAGGIVQTAGLGEHFLGNLKTWRSESDFDTQYWTGHLKWLRETFGGANFRTAHVREKALTDPSAYLAPPKLDDPSDKGYGKALGEAYSRLRDRRYEGYWLERVSAAHGNVSQWQIHCDEEELPPPPSGPGPDPDPEPEPAPVEIPELDDIEHPHETLAGYDQRERDDRDIEVSTEEESLEAGLLAFDLETGDAGDLYRTPGEEFVRIGATATGDQSVATYRERTAEAVVIDMRYGRTITGHNIMAFDIPALVRAGALTFPEVHRMAADGRLFDAMLAARYVDPPMARDKGVDQKRKYDLGTLGVTYGLGEKLTSTTDALKKKYGSWDAIPWQTGDPDPERAADAVLFRDYMIQDVELSRSLHGALMEKLGGEVPEYLKREHRVAAIAAQIRHNGFLVDQPLLTERVEGVREKVATSLAWLAENAGIPLANEKGVAYKAPLSSKAGKVALEAAFREAGATSFWRTGTSGDFSTAAEHMRHLAQEYAHLPKVREIAKNVYRIVGARSVYQTALDHLMPDGRVHTRIGFEQATGRWSVTQPGLTVFGKRGGRHVERDVFLPDLGEVLIAADLSQVDMRAVAWLSGDEAYVNMLRTEDPHTELAIALFGDAKFRETAKAVGHGWNYGESLKRISMENDIAPAIVNRFDASMRERFPRLVLWRDEIRALAESGALLNNGFGRLMRPDPQRAHTQGPALMGQGAARDIMMQGLLRLPADILPMLRAQIHDEIVLSVPADQVQEIGQAVVNALSFDLDGVPILADVSRPGTSWGRCYAKG